MIKKVLLFIYFIMLTFVLTKSLFSSRGVPVTHDGNNHLVRFANFYIAVKELQIPPRLAPNLVNRYGYPVFNYNYPLANIISLPLSMLGFHYEFSFKLINIVFVFSGIMGAYYFLNCFNFSKKAKFFALSLFAINPYILSNIVFRGNIGEVMAWGLIPWIFYFLTKLKQEEKQRVFNLLFLKLFILLVMFFLAHNIIAFFGSGLIFFYLIFYFKKDFCKWRKFLLIYIMSFIACLWFWLPAIVEKNLVIMDNVDLTVNFYKHFPTLSQLLRPQIFLGYSYWGKIDSMSFTIGFVQIIILLLTVIFLVKNLKNIKHFTRKNISIFVLLSFLLIIFQLPLTKTIYQHTPFADFIQFPWRLSLLFTIVLIPVSAFIFDYLKKSWQFILVFFLIIQLVQLLSVRAIDYRSKQKIDYEFYPDTTSVNKENLAKTFLYLDFDQWQPSAEILEGEGSIDIDKWRGSVRSYRLNLLNDSLIVEPTAYFAGWETQVLDVDRADADWQIISYVDDELIAGRLAYRLDSGNYLVKSRFTQNTWPRIVGNSLSVLSFFSVILLFCLNQQKVKNRLRKPASQ